MFAKIVEGKVEFGWERVLRIGDEVITNPREEDWLRGGYKPVEENRLPEKEGYYQLPEYKDIGDKIVATYHYEENIDEETDA